MLSLPSLLSSMACRIGFVSCLLSAAHPAVATTMFRGDSSHTGVYAANGPESFSGVRWSFSTGGAVLSSPALVDGVIYIGSDDKHVYAVSTADGTERWRFATGGPVRSSPAVVDGVVYVLSYDGFCYALGAKDGALRWKFETRGERRFAAPGLHGYQPKQQVIPDFWDCFLSSPCVAAGRVVFGSGDGHVYAVDANDGRLIWSHLTGSVVHSSPAIVDGTVYIGSWDSYLYALDLTNGTLRWRFKTGEDPERFNQVGIQSSPAVVDGVVYFGCRDSHVYAVDARTGEEKWRYRPAMTWINASVAVQNGRVYGGTSIPATFFALNAADGTPIFTLDAKIPVFSSPAVAGNRAYFGSFNGRLTAVDLQQQKATGEYITEAARANAAGVLTAEGTFNPRVMFTSNFFENMYVTGDRLLSLGSFVSSPIVADGLVFVGSADGRLYALE